MKSYTMGKTALVTFIVLIGFALYDLAAVTFGGVGSSVSNWLVNVAHVSPIVAFTFGAVAGHLFWPMREEKSLRAKLTKAREALVAALQTSSCSACESIADTAREALAEIE